MYVKVVIMETNPGHEASVADSMHRYGAAARTQDGLQQIHTLKDRETGALVGLAIWDSEEASVAAGPALEAATKDDDFATWVSGMTGYSLDVV